MELSTHEFLQKIKKREKELLLEEANLEVRKELGENINFRIDNRKGFDELETIKKYKKAKTLKQKTIHRKALEEHYKQQAMSKFVWEEISGKYNFRSDGTYGRVPRRTRPESKSDIKKFILFTVAFLVIIYIILYLN